MLLLLLLLLFLMLTLTVIDVWYQAYKGEVGVTYASEVGVDVGQCIPVTRVSMTSTRATSLVLVGVLPYWPLRRTRGSWASHMHLQMVLMLTEGIKPTKRALGVIIELLSQC